MQRGVSNRSRRVLLHFPKGCLCFSEKRSPELHDRGCQGFQGAGDFLLGEAIGGGSLS
jgi:hypothetical protein